MLTTETIDSNTFVIKLDEASTRILRAAESIYRDIAAEKERIQRECGNAVKILDQQFGRQPVCNTGRLQDILGNKELL